MPASKSKPASIEKASSIKTFDATDDKSTDSILCTKVRAYTAKKSWSPQIPDKILNVWSTKNLSNDASYDFSITSDLKWGKGNSCHRESAPKDNSIEIKKEILIEASNVSKPKAKSTAPKSKTKDNSCHSSSKKIQVGNMVTA